MKATNRKLLLLDDAAPFVTRSPLPLLQLHTSAPPPSPPHLASLDSSMVLVVLVLCTVIFSVIFFCIYICRSHAGSYPRGRNEPAPAQQTGSRKGLDPAVVRSLPVSPYGGGAAYQIEDCAICLGEFGDADEVKVMPFCRHVFHPHCIDTWLVSSVSCPVCRSTRVLEEVGKGP